MKAAAALGPRRRTAVLPRRTRRSPSEGCSGRRRGSASGDGGYWAARQGPRGTRDSRAPGATDGSGQEDESTSAAHHGLGARPGGRGMRDSSDVRRGGRGLSPRRRFDEGPRSWLWLRSEPGDAVALKGGWGAHRGREAKCSDSTSTSANKNEFSSSERS